MTIDRWRLQNQKDGLKFYAISIQFETKKNMLVRQISSGKLRKRKNTLEKVQPEKIIKN